MNIQEFDYNLPKELIAQSPLDRRDVSKLMVINKESGKITHEHFYDIVKYIQPGDCIVMNNSKVIPARLLGKKRATGANIEFLLVKRVDGDVWEVLIRNAKRLPIGSHVDFECDKMHIQSNVGNSEDSIINHGSSLHQEQPNTEVILTAEIVGLGDDGSRHVKFSYDGDFLEILENIGRIPLPPYIEREDTKADRDRYQTVYCEHEGSIAAPTAGLHFTNEIIEKLIAKGVKVAFVTLHVGIGTFRPVKSEIIEEHKMHFEEYMIDEVNATIINETIKEGGKIISVGTTATRTIESVAFYDKECGEFQVKSGSGATGIFIYPPYEFKIINNLITNFHLPKSTLLMLISAFYDRNEILKAYDVAVKNGYRFFSYGDAMFLK